MNEWLYIIYVYGYSFFIHTIDAILKYFLYSKRTLIDHVWHDMLMASCERHVVSNQRQSIVCLKTYFVCGWRKHQNKQHISGPLRRVIHLLVNAQSIHTLNAHVLNLCVVYRLFTSIRAREFSAGYLDVGDWFFGRKRQKIKCFFITCIPA